ncbi:hypothetical protein ACFOYW_17755 [Gryllotalpicola reticulitermitis]|uniref:Peptidase M50 domain-containing protein n=1 Tax=Gryllotalpicola reticulitermitis TaxID=1184153 RepID=A0ABV8QBZ6_9MICO
MVEISGHHFTTDTGAVPPAIAFAPAAGYLIGACLQVVPHELGHLVVALVLRLPVRGAAIGRLRIGPVAPSKALGGCIALDVDRLPPRALPLRMILFALGGPLSGLLCATAAAAVAMDPAASLAARNLSAAVACAAAAVQIWNLLPLKSSTGGRLDGLNVVLWLTAPSAQWAQLQHLRAVAELRRTMPTSPVELADFPSLERLRCGLRDPHPQSAVRALRLLYRSLPIDALLNPVDDDTWSPEAATQARLAAPTILEFARRADIPKELRADAAGAFAQVLAMVCAYEDIVADAPPLSENLAQATDLAEFAWQMRPGWLPNQSTLGLIRLFQRRPADTRALLINISTGQGKDNEDRARAYSIRGLAELDLGNAALAERLAELASAEAPHEYLSRVLTDELAAGSRGQDQVGGTA